MTSTAIATTTALLIRHAHTDALGRALSGRLSGVRLSAAGLAQAEALGRTLATQMLAAVYASPLERAVLTAAAIARVQRLPVRVLRAALEIDFGEWTGRTFVDLDRDPRWQLFNSRRETAPIPGGESLVAAQQRIVQALDRLGRLHRGSTFAIVTHAEIIRLALLHLAGAGIGEYNRFDIGPASISTVTLGSGQA